jgi:hypothetical protein
VQAAQGGGAAMTNVLPFVPRRDRDANANLREFIRMCREDLTVFGADLDWSSNYWAESRVTFGNLAAGKRRKLEHGSYMQQPFLEFAKAYHRYRQGMRPAKPNIEMRALKCLERSLEEAQGAPSVEHAKGFVFDRAAVLCADFYEPGVAYRAGCELEAIAKFLVEKRLVSGLLPWRNTIPRPVDTVRTGATARKVREKKLPADELLNALAAMFASNPTLDRDVFTSSMVALLMCAPSRCGEVLLLPAACEVTEEKRNGGEAYGWRFFTGKGGLPMIKWIPEVMVPIAKEALKRIRRMTDEARRLAACLEDHPEDFFRHAGCPDVGEDEALNEWQIAACLGCLGGDATALSRADLRAELRRIGIDTRRRAFTLRDLNGWVHARLPKTFPWFDAKRTLKFRDALFCMRARQLRTDMGSSPVVLWRPTVNTLNDDLGQREPSPGYRLPNIFARNRVVLDKVAGKVTSHQFRHHLNTLAQRGGLAQSDIAKWSGRADPKQNRVYNHMSEHELAGMLREHNPALTLGSSLSQVAEDVATKMPMTRQEFNMLTVPNAHVTEFGFCAHDYVMSPCQRFRDCLNCTEHLCLKGDNRLTRLKDRLEIVREQVRHAEAELQEGSAGVDRWLEVHRLTVQRLEQLIAILEDPAVEDGAIVRLNNANQFSPFRRALEAGEVRNEASAPALPDLSGDDDG